MFEGMEIGKVSDLTSNLSFVIFELANKFFSKLKGKNNTKTLLNQLLFLFRSQLLPN